MKKIIQILGPTGVGKSKIAVEMAKKIDGEIISADSMQVYKDFDIGTDKISNKDMNGISHFLIDILSDCSQFNVSIFLQKSFKISEEIIERGKIPVVCGGTALYLKTMIRGIFPELMEKRTTRNELNRMVDSRGLLYLWEELNDVDPEYAKCIGKNDKVRIIRAMEIYYNNGIPPSEIFKKTKTPFETYGFIRIGLNIEREKLYNKIEDRVENMFKKGLIEEVKRLKDRYPLNCPPFKSLGYKEILMVMDGEIDLETAKGLIKQRSRNFAKRQMSWFRQEKDIQWFDPAAFDNMVTYVKEELKK